jgi:hypothetical protein
MDLIDYNPITGESVTMDWNDADGTFVIGHHQDCTPVIEENKRRILEGNSAAEVKAGWLKYASIPNIVVLKWKQEHGVDFFDQNHWPKVMGLLNSREYRYLKCTTLNHDR